MGGNMFKKLALFVFCLLITLLICGCRSQNVNYSNLSFNDFSSDFTVSDNNSENEQTDNNYLQVEEIPNEVNSSQSETNNNVNNNQQIVVNDKENCQHSYRVSERKVNCNSNGFVRYVCEKCNNTYEEIISPEHEFSKYFCENCGIIDPEADKFLAVSAWLNTYGKPNGKGNMMCYPNDIAQLLISNYLDQNEFFIEYNDTSRGIIFLLCVQGKDLSSVSFIKGSTHAYYTIKNSEFSSQSKIVFDEFYTNEESPLDEDTFATECASLIDEYMLKAQNDVFYPKMNLTLSDFGFTKYN